MGDDANYWVTLRIDEGLPKRLEDLSTMLIGAARVNGGFISPEQMCNLLQCLAFGAWKEEDDAHGVGGEL